MNILNTLAPVGAPNGSAVALGYFDGVHLGHRRVLGAAVEYAAAHGLTPRLLPSACRAGSRSRAGVSCPLGKSMPALPLWALPPIWNPRLNPSAA